MRARNIKPGLFKDEELADLPIEARYLFSGLWCLADCKGRLEDRPKVIKVEIFPFDENVSVAKVHHLLQLLADSGFIRRYETSSERYIHVINFEKHQNPHKQERDKGSQLPCPPLVEVLPVNNGTTSGFNRSDNGVKPEPLPVNNGVTRDDCGLLIADSLIPDSLIADCGKRKPAVLAFPLTQGPSSPVASGWPRFRARWTEITKSSVNIEQAAQAWVSIVTPDVEHLVFECLESYALCQQVVDGVLFNPDNWLWEQNRNKWQSRWPPARASPVPHLKKSTREIAMEQMGDLL